MIVLCLLMIFYFSFASYAVDIDSFVTLDDVISSGLYIDWDLMEFYDEFGQAYDLNFYIDDEEYSFNENIKQSSFLSTASNFSVSIPLEDFFIPLENKPMNIDKSISTPSNMPVLRAPSSRVIGEDIYKNAVVYSGRFNGSNVRLVVPYDQYKNLSVVNGYLINIGNSVINGRILYGTDDISPSAYETYTYILNPIYGTTSNVWRYGSFNYQRRYYLYTNPSTGVQSIQYSDTYGNFTVTDTKIHYSTSERLYYLGLVGLLLGGLFVCLKR